MCMPEKVITKDEERPNELPKQFSLENLILPHGIWWFAAGTALAMIIAICNAVMNSQ